MENNTQLPTETYLTIDDATKLLGAMGFHDTTKRQMQRWAHERKLPFFRMGKKLYIKQKALEDALERKQIEAQRGSRH